MLIIRLIRTGKKNTPSFRVVVTEKKSGPQSGKFLELLGYYNPRSKEINFKKEQIEYWLNQGAKTSETVHNLLIRQGIIKGSKIKKKIKPKKKAKTEKEEVKKQGETEEKESEGVDKIDKSEKKE